MTKATIENIDSHPFTVNLLYRGNVYTNAFADLVESQDYCDMKRRNRTFDHFEIVDERTGEVILEEVKSF